MKKWFIVSLLLVLLNGCSQQDWTESPTFTANGQTFQGVEQRMGFLTEDIVPISAGDTHKYLWHFWSNKTDYLGKFEVRASHQENGKTVHVFGSQNTPTAQPLNGANHHLQALMTLPDPGLWKIEITFDTVLFESVYVNVVE